MSISYAIDAMQVFRGMLFMEGWCCDGPLALEPALMVGEDFLEAQVERIQRPDVCAHVPGSPINSGFRIRAFLPAAMSPSNISVSLISPSEILRITEPSRAIFAASYSDLATLNDAFFGMARERGNRATVLEIGSRARSGHIRRQLFGDARYIGFDILEGENVDVVGDAHQLATYFPPGSVDFSYSISVFEHLMWPWKVSLELAKVMKIGGQILMQSHPAWPKHEAPWDFFRFSDSGWHSLFCEATGFRVLKTVEAHSAELVSRPYTGSPVHDFEGQPVFLASAVLAEKIGEPAVEWSAAPPLKAFGGYPH